MTYSSYIASTKWKKIATECKRRSGFRCAVCNSEKSLHAHHRTYEHLGHEETSMDDLTCLCKRCHSLFHREIDRKPKSVKKQIEMEMPPFASGAGTLTLTKQKIKECATGKGGFNQKTKELLGAEKPYRKGWLASLVGKEIPKERFRAAFLAKTELQ